MVMVFTEDIGILIMSVGIIIFIVYPGSSHENFLIYVQLQ